MTNAEGFQELLPNPSFAFGHYPDLCFSDDVTMLDATEQTLESVMNIHGCLSQNSAAHLLPPFPNSVNVDTIYTDEIAMLDTLFFQCAFQENGMTGNIDRPLGSTLDAGDHLYQDYTTHNLTNSPFKVAYNSSYHDFIPSLDTSVMQSTPRVDTTPTAVAESGHLALRTIYSGLNNGDMQRGPAIHAPLGNCNIEASERHTTKFTLPIQTRYATAEDWERHRSLFKHLYLDENRTLEEVKSIMKERYGFNATDKMYRKRVNDWKLHKNHKALEKEEILRCVETNRRLGVDLGEPMVNGRMVKMHVIERHRKEKRKAGPPSPSVADSRPTKCARLRRPTYAGSISFSRIEDPTDYRNYQNLLFQVDQYYNSKLENEPHIAWDAWQRSSASQQIKVSCTFEGTTYTCALDAPEDIFARYMSAVRLLEDNRTREAWRMIQEGAEMVRPLLLQESPIFIKELLVYVWAESSAAHTGVKMQLLHLISAMATVVYGDRHPISTVCQLVQSLHRKQDVIELTMRKLWDVLKHRLGHNHSASLRAQRKICEMLLAREGDHDVERSLWELVGLCERFQGRNAYDTRHSLVQLAEMYYLTNRYSEAEDVLVDVLQRGKKWGEYDHANMLAKTIQGDICLDRGDYGAAEALFWPALSESLFAFGPREPDTIRLWIEYQEVRDAHQKRQNTSAPLSPGLEALPEVSKEPLRRLSHARSSSEPPMDHRGWEA